MTRGRKPEAFSGPIPDRDQGPQGDRVITSTWATFAATRSTTVPDTGVTFLLAGVGGGKSEVGAFKALSWSLRFPRRKRDGRPARGLILGKDFSNAKEAQFGKILAQVDALGLPRDLVVKDVTYSGRPRIVFWNGVELHAYSGGDEHATRSFEATFVWADEAEHMTARSLMTAIARTRDAEDMRVIVTSSPLGEGWIYPLVSGEYEEWRDFITQNEVRIFRWRSDQNPHLTRAQLRRLRSGQNAVARDLALQELDGRFSGTAEAPGGGPIDWTPAFVGRLELSSGLGSAAVVGADLGKNPDFTWFAATNRRGDVLGQDRFNIGDYDGPPDRYWPWVRGRLVAFVRRHGAELVVIDGARGGDMFAANLREVLGDRPRVLEYKTDSVGKKAAVIEALAKAIELGAYRVPTAWSSGGKSGTVAHVEDLRKEFRKLEVTEGGSGKRSFDHGVGAHDDGVVANALAHHGLALVDHGPTDEDLADWEPIDTGPSTFGLGGGSRWGTGGHTFW